MPFGIPSEDFNGGFGLPEKDWCEEKESNTKTYTSCEECIYKPACWHIHNMDKTHKANAYTINAKILCENYTPLKECF